MQIKAHILRDERLEGWREEIVGRWSYRQLAADPHWSRRWISLDAVAYHPGDGGIYCGLSSIDGDLHYRFDPSSERFECPEAKRWTDAFDVKIHRTVLHSPRDEGLYFGTSLPHDMDRQQCAAGGKVDNHERSSYLWSVILDGGTATTEST